MSYESTIIITGGTVGLGFECASNIARQRPKSQVIIASRSAGDDAAASINKATGLTNVKFMRLDLSDQNDVRAFVKKIQDASYPPISALVLNAGLQVTAGISFTKQDIETTFGVNHVGHALLFHLLVPSFAPNARAVITASGTHDPKQKAGLPDAIYDTAALLAHPDAKTIEYGGQQRYATSKLCNVLWLYAVERHRVADPVKHSWTINAMDPGLMPGTGLARDYNPVLRFVWNQILPRILPVLRFLLFANIHSPAESGQNLARLAIGSDVEGVSGKYYEGARPISSSDDSYDTAKQDDLWDWTVDHVSQTQAEKQKFQNLA